MGTKYRKPCQEEGSVIMGVKITAFAAKCAKVHVKNQSDDEVRVNKSRRGAIMALVSVAEDPG